MITSLSITAVSIGSAHEVIAAPAQSKIALTCLVINNPTLAAKKAYIHIGSSAVSANQIGPILIDAEDSYILNTEKFILDSVNSDKLMVWADATGMNIVVSSLVL